MLFDGVWTLSTIIGSITSLIVNIACLTNAISVSSSFSINIFSLPEENFLISVDFLPYYSSVLDEDFNYERLTFLLKALTS